MKYHFDFAEKLVVGRHFSSVKILETQGVFLKMFPTCFPQMKKLIIIHCFTINYILFCSPDRG
jgi:hypothetical protein